MNTLYPFITFSDNLPDLNIFNGHVTVCALFEDERKEKKQKKKTGINEQILSHYHEFVYVLFPASCDRQHA